ncbi:MFS transporter [Subtercola endophyticus]|uniref:MFS transporter n=1 Tax=Subtercola endophyticus TaxID=2895559 RepID=UPI001E39608F|nr:MFS transporter [Subtercola endophyticus]UFS57507.1 MFS transporter [Subtercola endophyticus]
MSGAPLAARQAEHRLVLLTATRWLPVGLVFGLTVLLPLERGLSLAQVGVLLSIQGFVVLGLELPTGGLADALGRRPLLIASGVVAVVSTALLLAASSFWMFALAMVLQGVFRALDSGPLEAWYVDAVSAHAGSAQVGTAHPDTAHAGTSHAGTARAGTARASTDAPPIERGLSLAAMALGIAIAVGALIGGALVAWSPLAQVAAPAQISALALPFAVATVLYATHTVLLGVLVREAPVRASGARRAAVMTGALRAAPRTIGQGLRLMRTSRVLRSLVLVEVFWSIAMVAFETLTPVRLADDLGGEDAAAALFGPASAAAWALFAAGAVVAGFGSRRIGVARTAIVARILNGLFVVVMGLVAGPLGLIVAYWLAYLTHGAAGPMHSALLHRQASQSNRALVLSMNSMVSGGSYSLGALLLVPLAGATSPGFAFVVAGAFSIVGAALYVPARRQEKSSALASELVERGAGTAQRT